MSDFYSGVRQDEDGDWHAHEKYQEFFVSYVKLPPCKLWRIANITDEFSSNIKRPFAKDTSISRLRTRIKDYLKEVRNERSLCSAGDHKEGRHLHHRG